MQVRGEIIDADKKLVCQVFNTLIQNAVELNFTGGAPPPSFIMWADEDVDEKLADRDSKLCGTNQIRFKAKYWSRAYGFKEDEFEVIDPAKAVTTDDGSRMFSAPIAGTVETRTDLEKALPPQVLQKVMEGLLKPVFEALEKGESHEAILERLVTMFPDLNTDDLVEILSRAMFAAEVWGRLNSSKAGA